MGFGGHALSQRHFYCGQHSLLIVMQHQCEDIHHFPIATGLAQHVILQLSERVRQFQKGCAVSERSRLALDDRQIMSPVVNGPLRQVVAAFDDPHMLAQDAPLGRHDQPVGIDPQADRPVRKRRRDAVAIALKADQAGGRDALAQLDEAVKGDRQRHQGHLLFSPDIGDGAGLFAMSRLPPQFLATLLQPCIQRGKVREVWHALQHLVAGIPNVLLDLPLLPSRGGIAELRLVDIVVRHGQKAEVYLPLLATANPINRRLHVVIDPTSGDAAKNPERVPMGIEQHLVGLQGIGPQQKGPAVRQLDMRHLQLRAFAAQNRKLLAPVELEGIARSKIQRHKGPAPRRLLFVLPIRLPLARKCCHPGI